ncbi:MAG: head-tail connector protein [Gammaproteobacteria bacterium]|uniref:Putative head-tail connector n=1 Tax=viral metagenome TaxID=1070528 RepID=A0A6M3KDS0_9ZZZZ|nr:head-tail connector protein [Gammaproteobacteria bacterium]MBU2067480.1 head-tail connector protein [Gammaproteobacteria bacterium]MBU2139490.1 head-tail connector protein [Gammaproteobacteria bacterium]MBU2255917.1 head-tail connector protein [Gammaproteobacteria bacterium]MBU2295562.1 head-tail connector protein [Gammaproteobacteria bacterium]
MSVPSLEQFKRHLRIRHSQEDEDLQEKLDTAIADAAEFLNRPIPWLAAEQPEVGAPVYVAVPKPVRGAILIMGAELYANREQGVVGTIYTKMNTAENMLRPFRINLGV